MNRKISDSEMVEILQEFTKQMLVEGYNLSYTGKMCALLIHACHLLENKL